MTKSHVGMGYELCPVCATKHNEVVLLDKQMKDRIEQDNFLGWNLCVEHKEQRKNGFEFLISIDESQSTPPYTLTSVFRTGSVMAVKTNLYKQIFNQDPPSTGLSFCNDGIIKELQNIMPEE